MPLLLRLSHRPALLWDIHCVIDASDPERWGARKRFLREVLRRAGVDPRDATRVEAILVRTVPRDLNQLEPEAFLRDLTTAIPIAWEDDLVRVPAAARPELVTRFTTTLVGATRPRMPKPVAAALVHDLGSVLGESLPDLTRVEPILVELLVHDLWRSDGSEGALAERIIDRVVGEAGIEFT